MNKSSNNGKDLNLVTLQMPKELKFRLAKQAKVQGTSLNELANYLLNMDITHLEQIHNLEIKLSRKNIDKLKKNVNKSISKIPKGKLLIGIEFNPN